MTPEDTPVPTPAAAAPPASASVIETPEAQPRRQAKPAKFGWWWGAGRRKTSVARVRLRPGSGRFQIFAGSSRKPRTIAEHFTEERDRADAVAALKVVNALDKIDVAVRVAGGGYTGQAQAIRLGVARALRDYDPSLEHKLRDEGFLTRDAREVERKKYGQRGARRRFQFSKR